MNSKTDKLIFIALIGLVIIIGTLHYITPGYMILYHDSYRRLAYFPITIGAILFGLRGGIILALLSCLSFIPHLLMFWVQGPQEYYSELSEIIFYLAAGVVIGFISSRENRLKHKLSISYKQLHKQAKQLVEAEKQLGINQKLNMLGHVSASLAHEIKNPLASLKGVAEILGDDIPNHHPKHEFIKIMKTEISRLNNSVEDVLQYCRGQQAKKNLQPESVTDTIQAVVNLLDNQIRKKQIILSNNDNNSNTTQDKNLDLIKDKTQNNEKDNNKNRPNDFIADSITLTQVLLNLLLNAIDAVDKHGQIRIDHKRTNKGYKITISDNGPGINDNIKSELFKPFVTSKDGGTGLGLSITRKLLKSFNGDISFDESTSGGARFTIFLPEIDFSNMER